MMIRDRLANDGRFLFRWRSYAPLVLLPLLLAALPEGERISRAVGPTVEHAIFFVSVFVAFVGLAIRWVTVAFVPGGTSGRSTLGQRADQLNTSGMYSIVRNPLYLGNFVVILGVVICVKVWWLVAIVALCYWLYIERGHRRRGGVPGAEIRRRAIAHGRRGPRRSSREFANWVPLEPAILADRSCCGASTTACWRWARAFFVLERDPRRGRAGRALHAMGGGGRRVDRAGCHDARAVPGAALPQDVHPRPACVGCRPCVDLSPAAAYHPRRSIRDLRKRPALSFDLAGAEGATAPEPLRQKDRRLMALWKAAGRSAGSPKG